MSTLIGITLLVVGYAIGRYRPRRGNGYQNQSEASVTETLTKNFSAPHYHLLNHVTLRLDDGTTQIDHILVSIFGVFVIETKHYKGWIFADPKQTKWTQVLFHLKFRFQNPILQNDRHLRAVRDRLNFLPLADTKSAVVFTGEAEFMTEMPEGVFTVDGLVDYIREHTTPVMSLNRMQFCVGRLETTRLAISHETDVRHIENLERWRGRRDTQQ